MGRRDLFFGVVMAGGLLLALASLFPNFGLRRAGWADRLDPPADAASRDAAARPAQQRRVASENPKADIAPVVAQVDAAFRRHWSELGITVALPADELAIMRRTTLALCGTIPSLEEIRRFETYPAHNRLALWTDALLADRRHVAYLAERLARAWVGTEAGPFVVYRRHRFVSWVEDQLAAGRPYDDLIRELVTATGLWTDRPATNFLTVTINFDEKEAPNESVLAGRVARAFLGIRLDCAECHDHPFQAWKQPDFQGLAAFFARATHTPVGIQEREDGEYLVAARTGGEKVSVSPRVPFLPARLPVTGPRRQRLAAWVTSVENRPFARAIVNRGWALLFGRPLVEPLDDIPVGGPWPEAMEILVDDFVRHGHSLPRLFRVLCATEVYRLDSRAQAVNVAPHGGTLAAEDSVADADSAAAMPFHWQHFPLTRLRPEQMSSAIQQAASLETIRGDESLLTRLDRFYQHGVFVERFGDAGVEEFSPTPTTIPQRLLVMNGELVKAETAPGPFNASTRIALLAPSDARAVEVAYLAVLTRRPSAEETAHFVRRLKGRESHWRERGLEDLCWTLLNSSEFAYNH